MALGVVLALYCVVSVVVGLPLARWLGRVQERVDRTLDRADRVDDRPLAVRTAAPWARHDDRLRARAGLPALRHVRTREPGLAGAAIVEASRRQPEQAYAEREDERRTRFVRGLAETGREVGDGQIASALIATKEQP